MENAGSVIGMHGFINEVLEYSFLAVYKLPIATVEMTTERVCPSSSYSAARGRLSSISLCSASS